MHCVDCESKRADDNDSSALRNKIEPSERPTINLFMLTIRHVALMYTDFYDELLSFSFM